MIFEGTSLSLVGGALAAGSAALAALYLLKLRRQRIEVPFAALWQRVLADTQSSKLFRRLRRLLSLLLQLALLVFLLAALADPRFGRRDQSRTMVLLVDTSASMQARDVPQSRNGPTRTRLDDAKDRAKRIIRGLSGDSSAMIVSLSARPSPVGSFARLATELERQIDALTATDAPANLDTAIRLARDALRGQLRPTLILVGDGAYDPALLKTLDLAGIDFRFASVGSSDDNVGITSFSARRYQANRSAYEVLVEIANSGSASHSITLEVLQDDEVVQTEALALKPGEVVRRVYPNLSGEGRELEARIRSQSSDARSLDPFPLDDKAFALLPPRQALDVLLVSNGNLFLEGALLLDENVKVIKIAPAGYSSDALHGFDGVIFDRFTPPTPPAISALYLNPQGAGSPFGLAGEVASPIITQVAVDHPLLRWVTLKDLNISRASRFRLEPGDIAVASAIHDPIVVARERGGKKTVAFGFELERSDLPLRVAFPVLVVNALDWFAGVDSALQSSVPAGRPIHIGPGGKLAAAGELSSARTLFPMKVGFLQVEDQRYAVNLQSRAESQIRPVATMRIGGIEGTAPAEQWIPRRELWSSLVLAALLLSVIEWWTYHRRITV